MRLVTFEQAGRPRVGELDGELIRVSRADSVIDLLKAANADLPLAKIVAAERTDTTVPASHVRLLPPLHPLRRNLFAVGWNYLRHFEEGTADQELPDHPAFFTKSADTVIGPRDPIRCDARISGQWDYEAEVAVVIGRGGRDIAPERGLDHIAGYLLANDVTVRDVQRRHGGQWFKGKSFDRTCPLGPALVTPDEVNGSIEFGLEIDGEPMQQATTGRMHFGFARLVAELSVGMSLHPGDILLCGTPEGVGYARTPARWLRPGQRLRTVSPQLGELDNQVVAAR